MAKPPANKLAELLRINWTEEDSLAFKQELEEASDRAAALIAASYLESTIEVSLRRALKNQPSRGDEMILFGTSGALASFAAKIRLCHLLNIYGLVTREDLLTIVTVRNEFAHSSMAISFSSEPIINLCSRLKAHDAYTVMGLAEAFKEGFVNLPPRQKFLVTCIDIEQALKVQLVRTHQRNHHLLRKKLAYLRKGIAEDKTLKRILRDEVILP